MKKLFLLLLITFLGTASAQADEMRQLTVNGVRRTYYLHVPASLPSGAPLVIMLHGAGADGNGARFLDADIEASRQLVTMNVMTTIEGCHHFGRAMRTSPSAYRRAFQKG